MAFPKTPTAVVGITAIAAATEAQWMATTTPLTKDVMAYCRDTKRSKIGDGTSLFSALPWHVDQVLTEVFKGYLDNAGAANGVALLDASGQIPASQIPATFGAKPIFVADIAARDALTFEGADGRMIIVVDATADVTVDLGSAWYVQKGTDINDRTFLKIGEQESLDVDYTSFVKDGDSADRLVNGTTNFFVTSAEKTRIANAVQTDDFVMISGGDNAAAYFTA